MMSTMNNFWRCAMIIVFHVQVYIEYSLGLKIIFLIYVIIKLPFVTAPKFTNKIILGTPSL